MIFSGNCSENTSLALTTTWHLTRSVTAHNVPKQFLRFSLVRASRSSTHIENYPLTVLLCSNSPAPWNAVTLSSKRRILLSSSTGTRPVTRTSRSNYDTIWLIAMISFDLHQTNTYHNHAIYHVQCGKEKEEQSNPSYCVTLKRR